MAAHSNCLIWAYSMWWRRFWKGKSGDVYKRKSRWGWFPHYLYGETINGRLRMVSYKPIDPRRKVLPPPMFKGRVCWGDRPSATPAATNGITSQ